MNIHPHFLAQTIKDRHQSLGQEAAHRNLIATSLQTFFTRRPKTVRKARPIQPVHS